MNFEPIDQSALNPATAVILAELQNYSVDS